MLHVQGYYLIVGFGKHSFPEAVAQNAPLTSQAPNHHVEGHRRPRIRLQEHSQKPESDKSHHVYVCPEREHCLHGQGGACLIQGVLRFI